MHFRAKHDCDPVEWVEKQFGPEIREAYDSGLGSYVIAERYQWLSPEMVSTLVDTRTHIESVAGSNNPMKRTEVAENFTGDDNPAKRPCVRKKISDALDGHEPSQETKRKISERNTGNEISEEHRRAISEAASERDTSYMQSEKFSETLSDALSGRDPTHPEPYEVEELSHFVRSSWEEEIGKKLLSADIEYEYEPEFCLPGGSYYPDFVADDDVIEIKGWATERSVRKAETFMNEHPSYRYVVVGDELPCDVHIPWENRDRLSGVLSDE
jgi:replication factor C small subunit